MTSPSGGSQYQQDVGAPGGPHGPKITSIFDFSEEALEQFAFWLEQRGLHIPIAQILGFSTFTAQTASVAADESTTSTAYTSLATGGPTISGLSAGSYLVIVSAYMRTDNASFAAYMGYTVNSAVPSDAPSAITANVDGAKLIGIGTERLTGGNNNIAALYRTSGATTAHFADRTLLVLKYANA